MTAKKMRLDMLLVERGIAETCERAQRLIRGGRVVTTGEKLDKPGRLVARDIPLEIKGADYPYVSRGGAKLAGALDAFRLEVTGVVALDLGASTGGFTDCLLHRGAARVYAVDVGRGQLHQKLLTDERVVSRERTHLDDLEANQFDPRPTLAVVDLSFISLRRAFPVLGRILIPGSHAVVLVKPQFEVSREQVPSTGVITDESLQLGVVRDLKTVALQQGLATMAECESPLRGGDGNREFFLLLRTP